MKRVREIDNVNSERINEIADILADGILRVKIRKFTEVKRSIFITENYLDCSVDKSVDGIKTREKGEIG